MEILGLLIFLFLIFLIPIALLWGIKSQLNDVGKRLATMSEELLALRQMVGSRQTSTAEEVHRATPEEAETAAATTGETTEPDDRIVRHEAATEPAMVEYDLKQPEEPLPGDTETPDTVIEEATAPEPKPEVTHATLHDAPRPQAVPRAERNYERFIGENLFGKIGILVFIIGIGYFVKYAIDRDWIGEVARTVLGFAVGVGMLVLAARLHRRYRAFSSLLAGGAFGVFYTTVTIAFHYYHLFTHPVAFALLCATTVFMAAIAIRYDRSELAVTALVGGFMAPFLISTGAGDIVALLTYICILNIGMFGLSVYKKWGLLPIISFVFTYAIAWVGIVENSTLYEQPALFGVLMAFVTLFYFVFMLPIFLLLRAEWHPRMRQGLLAVVVGNGFLYLLLGTEMLTYCPRPFDMDGLLALFIALTNLAAYLYLCLRVQGQGSLRSVMLALTVTFASIAVPMQFEGHTLLMVWAAETVVLLWLFIKERSRVYEWGVVILVPLTFVAYVFSWTSDYAFSGDAPYPLFFNTAFMTNLFVSVAALVFAYLVERHKDFFVANKGNLGYSPHQAIATAVGLMLLFRTFSIDFEAHFNEVVSYMADYLTAELILLVSTLVLHRRFEVSRYKPGYVFLLFGVTVLYVFSVVDFGVEDVTQIIALQWIMTVAVAFHLAYAMRRLLQTGWKTPSMQVCCALLCTVAWLTATRVLLLSLGITGFSTGFSLSLAVAAFVLMCVGMRYQAKVVRVVSLVEFAVVLGKLVVTDVWSMPPVGKIIVFTGLGALLLVLSFLYQKLRVALFGDEKPKEPRP